MGCTLKDFQFYKTANNNISPKTTQENYPTGKTAPSATGPGGLAPWALWFYGVFPYRLTGGAMASERRAHVR
jgi:hypothetical protein